VSDSEGATIVPIGRVVSALTAPPPLLARGDEGASKHHPRTRGSGSGGGQLPGEPARRPDLPAPADRTVLRVHPRRDWDRPEPGVFTTVPRLPAAHLCPGPRLITVGAAVFARSPGPPTGSGWRSCGPGRCLG
jgi:hypothetical protein